MTQTHIHLLITHLPIFGSILGGLVLAHGLWTQNTQTKIAAYLVLIISTIGAIVAYLTGEAAEETVENIQGIAKNAIDAHEDFALVALIGLIVLGAASITGIYLSIKKSSYIKSSAILILCISLISFGLVARTGFLGGQIRHTEINNTLPSNSEQNLQSEDDDD